MPKFRPIIENSSAIIELETKNEDSRDEFDEKLITGLVDPKSERLDLIITFFNSIFFTLLTSITP